ncbi:hypothetical protein C1J00_39730 [Streptomyces cahuitamycinicus]|uniref:Tetracyclin repressor-like C-terminal domain-containing protein n=1 Tax=Streptomyces cahuitamycinicus TaxID=2070367 RepID=A0A2N8TCY0_9ACTN|nr:hypothetical protein C1J00_39730 [Streptomyces cahuitamycinicus]
MMPKGGSSTTAAKEQALCLRARDATFSRPGFALRSVIHECDTVQAERFHGVIFEGVVKPTTRMLRKVVEREIERGEVRPEVVNGYVFDAIPAMMMYRSKMCGCECWDGEVEETIDQLMPPLLRPHSSRGCGREAWCRGRTVPDAPVGRCLTGLFAGRGGPGCRGRFQAA